VNPQHICRAHDLRWDEQLQDYLDDRLVDRDLAELETHLSLCAPCCTRRDDLRSIIERPGLDTAFDRRLLALVDAQPHS
jgi:hypothetical protein